MDVLSIAYSFAECNKNLAVTKSDEHGGITYSGLRKTLEHRGLGVKIQRRHGEYNSWHTRDSGGCSETHWSVFSRCNVYRRILQQIDDLNIFSVLKAHATIYTCLNKYDQYIVIHWILQYTLIWSILMLILVLKGKFRKYSVYFHSG